MDDSVRRSPSLQPNLWQNYNNSSNNNNSNSSSVKSGSGDIPKERGIPREHVMNLFACGVIGGIGVGFIAGVVVGRLSSSITVERLSSSITVDSLKERLVKVWDPAQPNAIFGSLFSIGCIALLGSQQLSKTARKIVIVTVALGALALLAKPALASYLATKAVVLLDPKVRVGLFALSSLLYLNHIFTKGLNFEF